MVTKKWLGVAAPLVALAAHDLTQRRHALLRTYPVLGHSRSCSKRSDRAASVHRRRHSEERPFTRDQRRWVYASAKLENNYFGFGTDNDIE